MEIVPQTHHSQISLNDERSEMTATKRYRALPLCMLPMLVLTGMPAAAQEAADTSALNLILGNPIIALLAIVGLGLLIGKVTFYGMSLGSSGVIFVALAFGAWGFAIPENAGTFGLILFVYCVGISAGPTFFRSFVEQGADLAKLGVVLVIAGGSTTICLAYLGGIPADLATGIFAGSMTSTPALAAGMDALQNGARISIGYGIAYPFGVVGVVLFVQLLPRLLRINLEKEGRRLAAAGAKGRKIDRALIEVRNPSVFGKKINEAPFIKASRCQVPRILEEETAVPITPETVFQEGQYVLAVGDDDRLPDLIAFLGRRSNKRFFLDSERQHMRIVATSPIVLGKSLRELNLLNEFGVTISRVERNDVSFVPDANTIVRRADVLHSVGEAERLQAFADCAGHRARVVDETDLISLMVGLSAGIILGMVPIGLAGTQSFSLGMAGGPLLVGLILGHFGHVGTLRGHIPRAARKLMTEVGLVFFLAGAGTKAGAEFLTVLREYGIVLPLMAACVTAVPMIFGYFFARNVLKLNILQALGGTCGGMTSTPGLGVISERTDSKIPTVSYATAYPVALILMTLIAQLIVTILR